MDLRKYINKKVDARKVLNYEHSYFSYSGSEYSQPCLCIAIERNEEILSALGYELMLKLEQSGKITKVFRLQMTHGIGREINKFPDDIEEKASLILSDIILPASHVEICDFSILNDKYNNH